MTAIWNAAAGTPTGTHRVPVDTGAAGSPTMYTVQQLADLETSVGVSVNALGSIGTNTSVDLSLGGYVSATITGNLTLSFTNPPAGGTEFTLVLTNGGAFTVTWPGSVTWAGATAPTLTASGTDVLHFTSGNGGTNWYGWHEKDETYQDVLVSGTNIKTVNSTSILGSGDIAISASPAGSGTELQYRNGGAFGAMAGTAWDDTNRCETRTGATVTTSKPVQSFTQTWNAGAVTFTGALLNITNTASAATSRLHDWQLGGTSQAHFGRTGTLRVNGRDGGLSGYSSFGSDAGGNVAIYRQTALIALLDTGVTIPSNSVFGFSSSGTPTEGSADVRLYRDAADTLAQRRTTNAQTWRVYGTYTDASNYVRAALAATSTAVTLAAQTAGTGADDVPVVITPAGASQVEVGNGVQFTEMTAPSAPAANKVILFAQDNGAGKTQLMALFASGAAQQVAIEP